MVGLVRNTEEFQAESQFQKSEYDFDRIEPSAALGQVFLKRGE